MPDREFLESRGGLEWKCLVDPLVVEQAIRRHQEVPDLNYSQRSPDGIPLLDEILHLTPLPCQKPALNQNPTADTNTVFLVLLE